MDDGFFSKIDKSSLKEVKDIEELLQVCPEMAAFFYSLDLKFEEFKRIHILEEDNNLPQVKNLPPREIPIPKGKTNCTSFVRNPF